MFRNCLAYNPPGSDVTIIAKIVQKFLHERVERMKQLERTKIEIVIQAKENIPKKSRGRPRGWQKGRPRKTKNKDFDHLMREKWPGRMFTAKARDTEPYMVSILWTINYGHNNLWSIIYGC